MNLSILIPTYNTVCLELVKALSSQAETLTQRQGGFSYEIIVADDGSTDKLTVERNKEIDLLPHCRYIIRENNAGRAAIRNFLAQTARGEWLLFIDSDMVLRRDSYLSLYASMAAEDSVVYGGYTVRGDGAKLKGNLRYTYETKYSGNDNAAERNKQPYNDFHTSNFMVKRSVMLAFPLDERLKRYGYEDVLWGKTLRQNGVRITHIDNQLSFEKFETNAEFISKTEEGLNTLFAFRHELMGYSNIISAAERIERLHLTTALSLTHKLLGKSIRNTLKGNKTSVLLFNIYKLGYFCHLIIDARRPKNSRR